MVTRMTNLKNQLKDHNQKAHLKLREVANRVNLVQEPPDLLMPNPNPNQNLRVQIHLLQLGTRKDLNQVTERRKLQREHQVRESRVQLVSPLKKAPVVKMVPAVHHRPLTILHLPKKPQKETKSPLGETPVPILRGLVALKELQQLMNTKKKNKATKKTEKAEGNGDSSPPAKKVEGNAKEKESSGPAPAQSNKNAPPSAGSSAGTKSPGDTKSMPGESNGENPNSGISSSGTDVNKDQDTAGAHKKPAEDAGKKTTEGAENKDNDGKSGVSTTPSKPQEVAKSEPKGTENPTANTAEPNNKASGTTPNPPVSTGTTSPPPDNKATATSQAAATATTATATTEPAAADTASTQPPAADTASTQPPATDTASTQPPATDTASTQPPATDTASTQPPATDTTSTQPPATDTATTTTDTTESATTQSDITGSTDANPIKADSNAWLLKGPKDAGEVKIEGNKVELAFTMPLKQYYLSCVNSDWGKQQCASLANDLQKPNLHYVVLHTKEDNFKVLLTYCVDDLNKLEEHLQFRCKIMYTEKERGVCNPKNFLEAKAADDPRTDRSDKYYELIRSPNNEDPPGTDHFITEVENQDVLKCEDSEAKQNPETFRFHGDLENACRSP